MKSVDKYLVHRVDLKELNNRICINLARMGFSDKLIQQRTGFTPCQIHYRLSKAGVTRREYRLGESEIGQMVVNGTEENTRKRLEEMRIKLRPLLEE